MWGWSRGAWRLGVCALAAVLAASCADGDTVASDDGDAAEVADEELPETERDPDAPTAQEVYAEIAAMDLSYEERLDYLYEEAKEEGAVLSYGAANLRLQEPWSEGFQETYPEINHLYVRQSAVDIYQRVTAEARADRHLVDVIMGNAIMGARIAEEGLLAEHHGVPVPEAYLDIYVEPWAITSYLTPNVITWNTNAISAEDAPREWDDFLEPEHSGCAVDVGAETFVGGLVHDRGVEGAEEWLQGFFENGGLVGDGHSHMGTQLAAGEYDCLVYNYLWISEPLRADDGAPIDWHVADPTPASASSVYIYRHTERPHAAALFAHYLLSVDGAQVVADDGPLALHPDVELAYDRVRPFLEEGSDYFDRLLPMVPSVTVEVDEDTHRLLEEYMVPNLVRSDD